jgi:hypothetical protein
MRGGPLKRISQRALVFNVKVYTLTQAMNARSLEKAAKNKYEKLVPYAWDTESFVESVKLLWKKTDAHDSMLRDVVARAAFEQSEVLLRTFDEFKKFVEEERSFSGKMMEVGRKLLIGKDGKERYLPLTCTWAHGALAVMISALISSDVRPPTRVSTRKCGPWKLPRTKLRWLGLGDASVFS